MSDWTTVFLGVIAVASLATAVVQVGLLVSAARLAKRVEQLVDMVDREMRPILGHLNAIGRDASHATALAAAQVERADRVFGLLVVRLEETLNTIQVAVARPAREAAAVVAGLRTALSVLRDFRGRRRSRADEEDALFI